MKPQFTPEQKKATNARLLKWIDQQKVKQEEKSRLVMVLLSASKKLAEQNTKYLLATSEIENELDSFLDDLSNWKIF